MRRWGAAAAFVAIVAAGALALALTAAADERRLAFTTDVLPTGLAAVIQPGQSACERDVHVEQSFDAVQVRAGGRDRELGTDLRLVFARRQRRSVLSQLPAVFHRAALFRPKPVGAWTFWALLAAVLIGVPALLIRALRSAEADAPAD